MDDSSIFPLLEAAERYRENGYSVIPIGENKRPALRGEGALLPYQGRLPTRDEIADWFLFTDATGLAVVLGPATWERHRYLWVLDIEREHRAEAEPWLDEHLPGWREAMVVGTGDDGLHLYLQSDAPVSSRTHRWGEIRGRGNYALLPPSVHPDTGKPYRFLSEGQPLLCKLDDLQLPPAPGRETVREPLYRGLGEGPIKEGARNNTLFSLAAYLRRAGLDADGVIASALEAVNRECCEPPLDDGEVARIAHSVAKYPAGERRETRESASGLRFRTAREILAEKPGEVDWLAKPWVARGTITELSGKVKTAGKTTFALQMARAIMAGTPFMDGPTTKTPIIYLTEQPPQSFLLTLWEAGLARADDLHVLHYADAMVAPWEEIVRAAAEHCRSIGAGLLIVDTLHQFAGLAGDAENNTGEALKAMRPLQQVAGEGLGVLAIRHDRKAGGEVGDSGRGSSAFSGAADITLSLRRPEGNIRPTIREIHGIGRGGYGVPQRLVIELIAGGTYKGLGDIESVTRQEAEKAVLRILPERESDAVDVDEVEKASGVKRTSAQEALRSLFTSGRADRRGRGVKNDPHRYWRFAASADGPQSAREEIQPEPFDPGDRVPAESAKLKEDGSTDDSAEFVLDP